MGPETLEVALAPDAALDRVRAALARRPKRILGLKVEPEYVGVVQGRRFEVWERRRHAVHLLGTVEGVRGGSRVTLESSLTRRARILIGVFFAALVPIAFGAAVYDGPRALPELAPAFSVGAVLVAAALFRWIARQQHAALRRYVRGLLSEA